MGNGKCAVECALHESEVLADGSIACRLRKAKSKDSYLHAVRGALHHFYVRQRGRVSLLLGHAAQLVQTQHDRVKGHSHLVEHVPAFRT